MDEIPLASRYSADNYPIALENLVRRYKSENEPVHYSKAQTDELSKDQAQSALKFFGDIELIEVPKQGEYVPPEHIITWIDSIEGPAKREAQQKSLESLQEYEIYKEARFSLSDGNKATDQLVREIGGRIGASKDDLSDIENTIEVLGHLGFLDIDEEGEVSLPDEREVDMDEEDSERDITKAVTEVNDSSEQESEPVEIDRDDAQIDGEGQALGNSGYNYEISVSIDATEMSVDDLEAKLDLIEDKLGTND
jgi:hypothetical protein